MTSHSTILRHSAHPGLKRLISPLLFCSTIFLGGMSTTTSAQEIAFAFTNTLSRPTSLDSLARAKMLVNSLKRVNVTQSMFLIRTGNINAKNNNQMMFYDDSGQLLVNAGDNESLLSRKDDRYTKLDIWKANFTLSQYINYHQHVYYPYLYEGGDTNILSSLRNYLAERGYQPTYITYYAHDDYMDELYQNQLAEGKYVDIEKLQKAYVKSLMDDIIAYDAKAWLLLGYNPRQVILLHETDLTAYSMVSLVDALIEKGFKIISPEKIFSDPVINPFFISGYSANDYMPSITGLPSPKNENLYELNEAEKQKTFRYLKEQGLEELIPNYPIANSENTERTNHH